MTPKEVAGLRKYRCTAFAQIEGFRCETGIHSDEKSDLGLARMVLRS